MEKPAHLGYPCQNVPNGILALEEWWRGFFYFFCFFLLHVYLWRFSSIRKSFGSLLLIFIGIPSILYSAFFLFGWITWEWVSAWLIHILVSANYIAAYPAIAAQSPTLEILSALKSHPDGISWKALLSCCPTDSAVEARIEDLVTAKLLVANTDGFQLSRRGRLLGGGFVVYRRFLGLTEGQG